MRLLRRRKLDDDVFVLPEPAVVREPRVGCPSLDDDLQRLFEARLALLVGHAEAGELGVAIALADAELQTAAGHQIECRGPLGEQHRIVPGQDDDRCTKPQRCRARGHPGKQVERSRHLPEAAEVVLNEEARIEPERLSLDARVDVVAETLRRIAVPKSVGSSRVDLQACKLEYSIVSPK